MYEIYRCYQSSCKEGTTLNEHWINFLSPILVDFLIFTLLLSILVFFYNKSKRNKVDRVLRDRALTLLDRYLCSIVSSDQVLLEPKSLKSGKGTLTVAFGGLNTAGNSMSLESDSAILSNEFRAKLRDITLMFGASGSEKMNNILFEMDSNLEEINRIHPKNGIVEESEVHTRIAKLISELAQIHSRIFSRI